MPLPDTYLPSHPIIDTLVAWPFTVNLLSVVMPYIVIYLYLWKERRTRPIRWLFWLVGLFMTWIAGGISRDVVPQYVKHVIYGLAAFWNLDVAVRYAFLSPNTTFHPLPRPPSNLGLHAFRQTRRGQALDLLFGSLRDHSPSVRDGPERSLLTHLGIAWLCRTGCVYIFEALGILGRSNQLKPHRAGVLPDLIGQLAMRLNSWPWLVVHTINGGMLLAGLTLALYARHHLAATVFIGIGYSTDEEWPSPMWEPWLADSLNDLWRGRHLQYYLAKFNDWSALLSRVLGIKIRTVNIFFKPLASASLHTIMFAPNLNAFRFWPWGIFFLGQGIGVILERAVYYETERKVGGWLGWLWMIMWTSVWAGILLWFVDHGGEVELGPVPSLTVWPWSTKIEWPIWLVGW